MTQDNFDYYERNLHLFSGRRELWREPLGALRLTLAGDPTKVDVVRAQAECEKLVKVLNGFTS